MDGSGNACEQDAPTPHGTVCNGQQALPLHLPPHKKATFTLEEVWVDVRLQPCSLMEMGYTG